MVRGTWCVARGTLILVSLLGSSLVRPLSAQAPQRLTVFNAGSLGRALRQALDTFSLREPGLQVAQENSGSLEAARKLTELGKIPDVIALADVGVFPALLTPAQTSWDLSFARSEMVLAYSDHSLGASEITPANWASILLRPGVRTGRSDPALDPNGYRTLMVTQLEERRSGTPGLAARLLAAMPERYIRPKEADLIALVQTGDLDYAWSYKSIAQSAGLRTVDLPADVDLSDPALAARYAEATVTIPATGTHGPLTVHGAPILYALSIPRAAPDSAIARRFVQWLLGPEGKGILTRNGFTVLDRPMVDGDAPAWVRALAR